MKHAREDYNLRIQDSLPEDAGGIPAAEPVFLLRAQDVLAPMAMEAWIRGLEHHGGDAATIAAVRQHIDRFHDWQTAQGAKIPDAPPAELQAVLDRDGATLEVEGVEEERPDDAEPGEPADGAQLADD